MTEKTKTSTYRPLADRGDFMKWYQFTCMFCDHSQDMSFINQDAMQLNFWNPVKCHHCGRHSTPERKDSKGDDKKEKEAKKKRIKANMEARVGLFDTVAIETIIKPRQTILSEDRVYRYQLWREWPSGEGFALFIGLNPSTADETNDDPTIRRCINFAKNWGYQALCMANLFAFRATEPLEMKAATDPVGPDNDQHLTQLIEEASVIVAAWGINGDHQNRDKQVLELIRSLGKSITCLGLTSGGMPRHPLYIKNKQELVSFE